MSISATYSSRFAFPVMALGLLLLATIIYWPVHRFGFVVYDDADYIVENPHAQAGFNADNFRYAFATAPLGNWAPLVWISYFTDQYLFHLRPGPMHVENYLLHGLCGIFLWMLMARSTGAIFRSYAVAALFICHPMHVESVAWISERKDVLSILLLFAALWAYVRYTQVESISWIGWYVAALTLYVLSLMSKAMGITLPAILLLMDFWPLRRTFTDDGRFARPIRLVGLLTEKIPFFVLAAAGAVIAMLAQRSIGATATLHALPLGFRIGNLAVTFPIYILKLLFPTNLAVFYPHPGEWPAPAVAAGGAILLLGSVFTARQWRHRPYLPVGWFWFLITLLPVSGLAQAGVQSMADRYSYLPSVGLLLMVVWLLADVTHLEPTTGDARPLRSRIVIFGMLSVVAGFAVIARQQVGYWRDSDTLYRRTLSATGRNWFGHYGLGTLALNRGDVRTAVDEFNRSIADESVNPQAYDGLGHCWQRQSPVLALKYFRQAVAFDPRTPKYRVSLAADLVGTGDLQEAAEQLQTVLRDFPEYAPAVIGMSDVTARMRKQKPPD